MFEYFKRLLCCCDTWLRLSRREASVLNSSSSVSSVRASEAKESEAPSSPGYWPAPRAWFFNSTPLFAEKNCRLAAVAENAPGLMLGQARCVTGEGTTTRPDEALNLAAGAGVDLHRGIEALLLLVLSRVLAAGWGPWAHVLGKALTRRCSS